MMPIRTILVLVLAAAGWLGQDTPKSASATSPTIESARKRWERFSPEEKARARTRYERFLAMTEEEREQLVESARQLHERSERVQKELGQKDGERLATMEPAKTSAEKRKIVNARSATAPFSGPPNRRTCQPSLPTPLIQSEGRISDRPRGSLRLVLCPMP